jgi:predicted phosphodiesterase
LADDWSKVLAFGCTHIPLDDKAATAWRLKQIAEYQPDYVVHLGDAMDADGASRWPNEHDWSLLDEYRLWAEDLRLMREAAGKAKVIWLLGNHDANLSAPNRIPKKLREACAWTQNQDVMKQLGGHVRTVEACGQKVEVYENCTVVPYGARSVYRLGQLTLQHGAQAGVNSDRNQCLLFGVEHGLYVSAHTHRPVGITQVILPGRIPQKKWYANVGCGADWDKMEYVQRSNIALWGHGLLKVRVNVAQRRNGGWATRQWEADPGVVILRTAHD